MDFTVKDFINDVKRSMEYWENGLKQIKNGTFKYDDSMPKDCVDALYKHKVEISKNALEYLYNLDENLVIQTNIGTTKEGSKYYDMINK